MPRTERAKPAAITHTPAKSTAIAMAAGIAAPRVARCAMLALDGVRRICTQWVVRAAGARIGTRGVHRMLTREDASRSKPPPLGIGRRCVACSSLFGAVWRRVAFGHCPRSKDGLVREAGG